MVWVFVAKCFRLGSWCVRATHALTGAKVEPLLWGAYGVRVVAKCFSLGLCWAWAAHTLSGAKATRYLGAYFKLQSGGTPDLHVFWSL